MARAATPAQVIREVFARTCGRPVREDHTLGDLQLDEQDCVELLAALELALRCEAKDVELTRSLRVSDLIELLKRRAA